MKNRRKLGISTTSIIRNVHVVLLGQDGVGKSALTVRLMTRRYIGEYDEKLESTYRHHIDMDHEFIALDVMDTAGKNTRKKLDFCFAFGELFVVLYSITDKASFVEASKIGRYLRMRKTLDSTSLVLVGTKRDLEHFRQVRDTDGRKLTHELNCGFYEISISEGYSDTIEMFRDILRRYLDCHPSTETDLVSAVATLPPASPTPHHKDIKSPSSSWAKVKGLRTIPFRRKSVQTN